MRLALREALLGFRRAPLLSALGVTTIAFSLFAFGLFGLVALNICDALRQVEERVEVRVCLSDSTRVETAMEAGTMYVDVIGESADDEDMGLLIGRHGQTLESLQEIARAVIGQRLEVRPRVVVDVEDYRKRQLDRLTARVRDTAERVAQSGRSEKLEPMNAFLRKIVHDTVAEVSGAESSS